ncbi:MAG: GTPase domain-containing protein [Planctomycetaceae bacterium]|nr:GTPase domain-containing protein [Planctomycetaceae bacterium]
MILSHRSWVIGGLIFLPVLVYVALGGYALWTSGLTFWAWAMLPFCWLVAWTVGRLWPLPTVATLELAEPGSHWTDRDRLALEIVRQRQLAVPQFSPDQLTDPHFYIEQVKSLAMELAAHYYPNAQDPYSSLKVTEVLSAVHLAVEDLEELTTERLPVAQWLTIGQWQALGQTPKWYTRVQESVWLSSIVYNPLNLLRYFTSKATVEPLGQQLQQELLIRLYMKFVFQVGFYLIEMNSGRLRGGTLKYRQYFGRQRSATFGSSPAGSPAEPSDDTTIEKPRPPDSPKSELGQPLCEAVRIVLVGQVSSGKSSLINALLGTHEAACDVLPTTRDVQRYAINLSNTRGRVELLDTPGYGEAGASREQQQQIEQAATQADAILLVMSANTSARKPDQLLLEQLEAFYKHHPDLKFPPMIGVLTHVDLLKPAMIWNPPYDWRTPHDLKGRQIQAALNYVSSIVGKRVSMIIPVCSAKDPARRWGVTEQLLPALSHILRDAQSTSLLRLFQESLQGTWKQTLQELKQTGLSLVQYWRNR